VLAACRCARARRGRNRGALTFGARAAGLNAAPAPAWPAYTGVQGDVAVYVPGAYTRPAGDLLEGENELLLYPDLAGRASALRCLHDSVFGSLAGGGGSLCSASAHTAGFAAVVLQTDGGPDEATGAAFSYRRPAAVLNLLPATGPGDVTTVLHVSGADFSALEPVCLFGAGADAAVPAHFESSALLRCPTPARPPGQEPVDVEENGRFAAARQLPTYDFVSDAAVLTAEPPVGDDGGGTVVIVGSTAPQLYCRFGSIGPVAGRVRSEGQMACISPAHAPGSVALSTAPNLVSWTAFPVDYEYLSAPAALGAAEPERGFVSGGDTVRLWIDDVHAGLDWRCTFGAVTVPAQASASCSAQAPAGPVFGGQRSWLPFCSSVTCISPAHAAGVVVLTLSSEAGETATSFWFVAQPLVAAVHPTAGPDTGGSVIRLTGSNFGSDAACLFDGVAAAGSAFVSSALVLCETPPYPAGGTVGVDVRGGSGGLLAYTFYALSVTGVSPASGSEAGGTLVDVSGAGFVDSVSLACRFGSVFPVAAVWRSPYVMQCVSPALYPDAASAAQYPQAVPVYASANGADLTLPAGWFEYQPTVHVTAATPRSGIHLGQTPVFVLGSGFVNSTALACRFGLQPVPAIFLSFSIVLCIAPSQAAGSVFLEVTTNGEDYSADRLIFYYGTCRTGFYCPTGEPLPCPRGAYCAGTANFNFTVCPPGTYQPQVAQAGCLPSPVGYIVPDFGTVYPRLCPRGAVCDVMGLSTPAMPCPPGHFCLDGTRTANFTDFRVPERPLPCPFGFFCGPGVSANQSVANNFTTPQPCHAGYLCEPGSVTPQGSGPCPSGHYCPAGQLIPCPPRTYCPNVANTEPKPCLPGTYSEEYGQATCKQCPPGTVCPGFARDLPEPCPPGYVCDQIGLPLPTARCPAGHFCLANTVTADPLAPLDEEQLLRASPIALNASNFRPQPCYPATYCLEGVGNSTTAEGVYSNPQPCNAGSYCEWATSDRTVAGSSGNDISNPKLPCPDGSYCPTGTFIPIPAPRGSFASGGGNAQAALCLPGTYTHYEGFQRCLACPAGYECRKDGTYKPAICDAGKYRSSRDSITCITCPLGTWSPYKGLTDEALCLPCNAGLVCGVDGMKNSKPYGNSVRRVLNGEIAACERSASDPGCTSVTLQPLGQASLCPEGYVCDARTSVAQDKCPDGYFCGYGTTPETQFANPCPTGFFCPAGTTAGGRYQFPCLACFYCPVGTGIILPRCPEGTRSLANAKSIDGCSADQITFWRVQPLNASLISRVEALAAGAGTNGTNSSTALLSNSTYGTDLATNASSANSTNSRSSTALYDAYAGFGRCSPSNFNGLQPAYVLDDITQERVYDIEGTPLIYYQVPRDYVVKMRFDFRNISSVLVYGEHYEVLVFTGDYSTQTACSADEYQQVPCPPWNSGDGINSNTMFEFPGRQFETKCPRSTNALEMPFWFSRNGLYGTVVEDNNALEPADGTFVNKKGLMELNLIANDDLQFRVEIRMLHGLYQAGNRRSFLDTMCMDLIGPSRGSSQPNASFHIVLPRNDDFQLPLNIPLRKTAQISVPTSYETCNALALVPTCRYRRPEVTLAFNSSFASEFMLADRYVKRQQVIDASGANATVAASTSYSDYVNTVPDVIALEGNVLVDAVTYWADGDPFLAMEYLPYFSACRGFDSTLLLYQVLQTGWTEVNVEGNYRVAYGDGCTLVPEDDTKFINQWAPQIFVAEADVCSLEFTCFIQESYATAAAVPRWFESTGDPLFYVSREPQSRERLFEASVVASDQSTPPKDLSFYAAALEADSLMKVNFGPASGSPAPGTVPKAVTFSMTYFPYTKKDKRLISAEVGMDEYQPAKTHDGSYKLTITLDPLGWFDLLNAFAFDTLFYTALFLGIGLLSDGLMYAFWGFCRMFTRLRDPPRFHSGPLLSLMVEPQVTGLMLAMIPFYLAELGVQQLFLLMPLLATFPGNIDDLGVSFADASTSNGRVGLCFLVISLHGLYATSLMLIPDRPKSDTDGLLDADADDDDEDNGGNPVRWQRVHFMAGSLLCAVPDLFLSEFSVGNTYGLYLYPCWFMMKVYHMGLASLMIRYVYDELLFAAIVGINSTMETIVTIAAGTFTEFALAYYLDVLYQCIEDLFLEEGIKTISTQIPVIVFQLEKLYYRVRKRTITEQLLHAAEEQEESQVEALMSFISGYGPGTTGLFTVPFLLYFIWDFNAQLNYTSLWGVTRPDLLLYVLFCTVMIPFQWIMDMLRFNAQEVFQGWKVYEYMKYARYRFRNRTARWKGLETQFDESIDKSLRTSDQMCFSNQWYFCLGMGASSGTLFVLAVQILMRAKYNMFADILFFVVGGIALVGCTLGRKAALALADLVSLWKIRSVVDSGETLFGDERDEATLIRRRGASTLPDDRRPGAGTRIGPVGIGDLTAADITSDAFRRAFLDANKLWLLEQLGDVVTPRTAARAARRARLDISSDEDSDVASVGRAQHAPVALSETSAFVMRQWAMNARARVPGRLGRVPVISTDDDSDDARFPAVVLSQTAASVLSGWLAASRSFKAAAPAAGALSSDGDSSSSRTRFPDILPSAQAQRVAASWLHTARQRRGAALPAVPPPTWDSDGASDAISSSDSSDLNAPAGLTARARAVALAWLGLTRIRRAVHTV